MFNWFYWFLNIFSEPSEYEKMLMKEEKVNRDRIKYLRKRYWSIVNTEQADGRFNRQNSKIDKVS